MQTGNPLHGHDVHVPSSFRRYFSWTSQLQIIPRLKNDESSYFRLSDVPVTLQHYTGPKKVNLPEVLNRMGKAYTDVCLLKRSLQRAETQEMMWLQSLFTGGYDPPLELSGVMSSMARSPSSGFLSKPKTPFVFGRLIDSPPPHADTTVTTHS